MQYLITRIVPLFLMILSIGCAHYEYDLIQPSNLTTHIGKNDKSFDLPPLSYTLRTVENRLVMRIYNQTDEPIRLLGSQSTVVDPKGESHPLVSQSIAPGSFIKLILPPMRPQYNPGPQIGIGVGGRFGHAGSIHQPYYPSAPQYLQVYEPSNAIYWDWKGESQAKLNLVFERGDKTFKHDFVFQRRKM
jgi:hypothetical protein